MSSGTGLLDRRLSLFGPENVFIVFDFLCHFIPNQAHFQFSESPSLSKSFGVKGLILLADGKICCQIPKNKDANFIINGLTLGNSLVIAGIRLPSI